MAIKYKIEWNYFNSKNKYRTLVHEFNDDQHFANFLKYAAKNQEYRKIIGYEKYFEEKLEFSANDLREAFNAGRNSKGDFESYLTAQYKRDF